MVVAVVPACMRGFIHGDHGENLCQDKKPKGPYPIMGASCHCVKATNICNGRRPQTTLNAPSQDICSLPKKSGRCRMHYRMYYYDKASGNCEKFVYGGCEGNANRFRTKWECENKCKGNAPHFTENESNWGIDYIID